MRYVCGYCCNDVTQTTNKGLYRCNRCGLLPRSLVRLELEKEDFKGERFGYSITDVIWDDFHSLTETRLNNAREEYVRFIYERTKKLNLFLKELKSIGSLMSEEEAIAIFKKLSKGGEQNDNKRSYRNTKKILKGCNRPGRKSAKCWH